MYPADNFCTSVVDKLCICLIFLSAVTGLTFETCPPTETAIVPSNSARTRVVWDPPETDGKGTNIAISHDHNPGELFPIGNTTVTYTALNFTATSVIDRAVCSFQIMVLDITPPFIVCPDTISIGVPPGQFNTSVVWPSPGAFDNSEQVSLISSHEPGDVFQLGTTEVSYIARDPSRNEVGCSFNVSLHTTNISMTSARTEKTPSSRTSTEGPLYALVDMIEEIGNATGMNVTEEANIFQNLTPLWKGMIGSVAKKPLGDVLKPEDGSFDTAAHDHDDHDEYHSHDHDDNESSIFDSPTMRKMDLFVHRNERAIEIACVTFISLVLIALIILGALYNKTIIQTLRLRHERKRTPFPSTAWEQCPQMEGMNDPLLQQEYTDHPNNKRGGQERTLLQPGEVLPLLINGNGGKRGKQK
ncbi:uncharacterized protein [Amphiura filiformis]|uniref:uncharacterized protein n=1 Tax=Amphiura filiformis TaxID=82378 RepID=UPI003B218149